MPDPGDDAVRALCGSLFAEPGRVEQLTHHPLPRPFEVPPHEHPWMIQFDLVLHCGGRATHRGGGSDLRGCSLLCVYPGTRHGYRLVPAGPRAEVFHLKLSARGRRELTRRRPFPEALIGLSPPTALRRAFDEAVRLGGMGSRAELLLMSAVSRVVALWPTRDALAGGGATPLGEALVAGTRGEARGELPRVLELIESRLADPPALAELAAASHLSPRHFARRFHAAMGCTPLAYVTARRLAAARRLLQDPAAPVASVGRELGFPSPPAFTRWFKRHAGVGPRAFRTDPTRM